MGWERLPDVRHSLASRGCRTSWAPANPGALCRIQDTIPIHAAIVTQRLATSALEHQGSTWVRDRVQDLAQNRCCAHSSSFAPDPSCILEHALQGQQASSLRQPVQVGQLLGWARLSMTHASCP